MCPTPTGRIHTRTAVIFLPALFGLIVSLVTGHFDWLANTYQVDSLDLDAVLAIGKRRYYKLLLSVLRSIYRDEGIGGEMTAQVLRQYRFSRREWRLRATYGS